MSGPVRSDQVYNVEMQIKEPFLALLLILLPVVSSFEASANPPRTYDASLTADPDDVDRGVLGVRYAVGTDIRFKTHVIVMNVVSGGPADQAGLKKGDRIVAIDGVEVYSMPNKSVGGHMRGAPNTVLRLRVKRGMNDELDIKLVRGGLSKLPDRGFRSRLMAHAVDEERDIRIRALCQDLAGTHPDMCALLNEGKFDEAEPVLERAVQIDRGQNLKVVLLYALVLDQNGKPQHARELIENIVTGRPKWAEAWESIALLDEEQGKFAEAIDELKKATMLVTDKQAEGTIRHHISELMEKADKTKPSR